MLGGAGNVMRNLASLGAAVRCVTVVGEDTAGKEIGRLLRDIGIGTRHLIKDGGRRTSTKGALPRRRPANVARRLRDRRSPGARDSRAPAGRRHRGHAGLLGDGAFRLRQGHPGRGRRGPADRRGQARRQGGDRRSQGRRFRALSRCHPAHPQSPRTGRGDPDGDRKRTRDRRRRPPSARLHGGRRGAGDARRRRHGARRRRRPGLASRGTGARGVRRIGGRRHRCRHRRRGPWRRGRTGPGGGAGQRRRRHRRRQGGHGGGRRRRSGGARSTIKTWWTPRPRCWAGKRPWRGSRNGAATASGSASPTAVSIFSIPATWRFSPRPRRLATGSSWASIRTPR